MKKNFKMDEIYQTNYLREKKRDQEINEKSRMNTLETFMLSLLFQHFE